MFQQRAVESTFDNRRPLQPTSNLQILTFLKLLVDFDGRRRRLAQADQRDGRLRLEVE